MASEDILLYREKNQELPRSKHYSSVSNMEVRKNWTHNIKRHGQWATICSIIVCIGEEKLSINRDDIVTHLIRSSAAMAMYLGKCPVYVIMMIGRWSSDAFRRYIRKQMEQFSHNVLWRILCFEVHQHVAEPAPENDIRLICNLNLSSFLGWIKVYF